jgi:hypothetical protein
MDSGYEERGLHPRVDFWMTGVVLLDGYSKEGIRILFVIGIDIEMLSSSYIHILGLGYISHAYTKESFQDLFRW